jgi:hypothetical protein
MTWTCLDDSVGVRQLDKVNSSVASFVFRLFSDVAHGKFVLRGIQPLRTKENVWMMCHLIRFSEGFWEILSLRSEIIVGDLKQTFRSKGV